MSRRARRDRGAGDDTAVAATVATRGEAMVIAALLADNGIRSATVTDDIAGRELPLTRAAGIRVLVRADQVAAARALVQARGDEGEDSEDDWPDLRASYNQVAAEYADQFDDELSRKPADRDLLDRFAAEVAGRGPVVDLGAGPGHVGAYLAARDVRAVALDLSTGMLAQCRTRHPELPALAGDLLALPLRDHSCAGAVGFYSYIHLRRWDLPAALAELRRVLAPGAPALLAVHEGSGEVRRDDFLGRSAPFAATLFEPGELPGLVTAAGAAVREAVTRDPYPGEHPTRRCYVWLSGG